MLNGLEITGAALAALFAMMGFAFFGKTLFNCIPIMAGVSLSALIVKKKPRDYALIAMFGTAMGPLITFLAFEVGVKAVFALPGSFLIGLGIGIILPPIAIAMLRLHQGYNLYNIGLTAGFVRLFTLIGFAFFGKHPKNVFPVVLGIIAAIFVFGKNILAPGPLLAILFGTALAPLAGEFGPAIGFVAGFLHLVIVDRTGAWHGGMDLYNNGFAAGLTATLIVSIIDWYKSSKSD